MRGLAECFAPVVTLVGKTWDLHLREGDQGRRRAENLRMIEESVAFLVAPGQGGGLRRRALLRRATASTRTTRWTACGRPRPAAPPGSRPATPTARRCPSEVARSCARSAPRCPTSRIGIHTHNDAECGVANTLAGRRERRPPGAGHDQRLRRALRQREPGLDHPVAGAEDGLRGAGARAARASSPRSATSSPRPRTCSPTPGRRTSAATPSPTRAACTSPACSPTPRTLRAHRPGAGRQRAPRAGVRAVRARHDPRQGPRAGHRRRAGPERVAGDPRPAEGPGAPGLPLRGRPTRPSSCCSSARPASTSRSSCSRASA